MEKITSVGNRATADDAETQWYVGSSGAVTRSSTPNDTSDESDDNAPALMPQQQFFATDDNTEMQWYTGKSPAVLTRSSTPNDTSDALQLAPSDAVALIAPAPQIHLTDSQLQNEFVLDSWIRPTWIARRIPQQVDALTFGWREQYHVPRKTP